MRVLPRRNFDIAVAEDNVVRKDSTLEALRASSSRSSTASTAPSPPATPRRSPTARPRWWSCAEERAKALGLKPLGFLKAWAYAAVDPAWQLLQGPRSPRRRRSTRAGLHAQGHGSGRHARGLRGAGAVEPAGVGVEEVRRGAARPRDAARRGRPDEKLNATAARSRSGTRSAATGARLVTQALRELKERGQDTALSRSAPPAASAPPSSWSATMTHAPRHVEHRSKDGVARASPDRRARRAGEHALRADFAEEFERAFKKLAERRSVKAIVFVSGKPDSFIAGADIDMLATVKTAAEATSARARRAGRRCRSSRTWQAQAGRRRHPRRRARRRPRAGARLHVPHRQRRPEDAARPARGAARPAPGRGRHAAPAAADRHRAGARHHPHRQERARAKAAQARAGGRSGAGADPARRRHAARARARRRRAQACARRKLDFKGGLAKVLRLDGRRRRSLQAVALEENPVGRSCSSSRRARRC